MIIIKTNHFKERKKLKKKELARRKANQKKELQERIEARRLFLEEQKLDKERREQRERDAGQLVEALPEVPATIADLIVAYDAVLKGSMLKNLF